MAAARCLLERPAHRPACPPCPAPPGAFLRHPAPQNHSNEDIYEKAVAILEAYFDVEDGEEENLAPAVEGGACPRRAAARVWLNCAGGVVPVWLLLWVDGGVVCGDGGVGLWAGVCVGGKGSWRMWLLRSRAECALPSSCACLCRHLCFWRAAGLWRGCPRRRLQLWHAAVRAAAASRPGALAPPPAAPPLVPSLSALPPARAAAKAAAGRGSGAHTLASCPGMARPAALRPPPHALPARAQQASPGRRALPPRSNLHPCILSCICLHALTVLYCRSCLALTVCVCPSVCTALLPGPSMLASSALVCPNSAGMRPTSLSL